MLAKSQFVWQNDATLEFVDYYKSEPMLWDPKHPDYKNKSILNNAWERISSKMSIEVSVADLKRKKESLMTAYRLHNRRRREEPKTSIFWFAFDAMDAFLGQIYNPSDNNSSSDHETVEEQEYRSRPIKKERPSTSSYTPRKRTSEVYLMPERESDIQDFDECELYARLLAKKIRRLDERQRDIVMHEIDNIIFRARMNTEGGYSSSHKKVTKIQSSDTPPVFIVSEVNEFEEEYLETDE